MRRFNWDARHFSLLALTIVIFVFTAPVLMAQVTEHQHPQTKPTPTPSPTPTKREPQQHEHHHPPAKPTPDKQGAMTTGTDESDAHAGHTMMSTITGGPFRSMRALGSGTALQPASTPMKAWHFMRGEWMLMLHGELKVGFNHQGGPRGVGKLDSQNWLMLMAEREAGPGRLMLRGMVSAEPLTMPHGGSPQLFQTG